MGKTSDEIRSDIAATRLEASRTVDELAQRFDVGERAQTVMREVTRVAREQPGQALAAAAAVGFLAGRVTKRRRK
jgi:ElaB/YqjD/DUF883 family membrane-anchored ribosome-binding protein